MALQPAAPLFPVSDDNHAAWVVVATLVFLTYAILGVGAKIIVRFNLLGIHINDIIVLVGTVLLIIESVCVLLACNERVGLGRHQQSLDPDAFIQFNKVSGDT